MDVIQNLITKESAKNIAEKLQGGFPTEDRILIAVPDDESRTASGLYIPNTVKEDIPRKGVIVQFGEMDQSRSITHLLEIGDVITFGLYAGKEMELNQKVKLDRQRLMVLSIEEIIYVEKGIN